MDDTDNLDIRRLKNDLEVEREALDILLNAAQQEIASTDEVRALIDRNTKRNWKRGLYSNSAYRH